MSCSGCRVLRKGCGDSCILRPCLQWIDSPVAQGHATLFVAKFFGRSDLMSFISAVPHHQRSALFQSLLFEACGRTINPVNGAVGLMWSGNWDLCKSAVDTILSGGTLQPLPEFLGQVNDPCESLLPRRRSADQSMVATHDGYFEYGFPCMQDTSSRGEYNNNAVSFCNEETSGMTSFGEERKILNLFFV